MTNKLEELKKKMEEAKDIALSARVNNGVTFKYTKIIDDVELPKREDNNEVWREVLIKEEYRTFSECASLYLDAKKAYETELDKHIPNKLEELEKKMKEADAVYEVAHKAFYFSGSPGYDFTDYFSIVNKRKKIENNYINARKEIETAIKAYNTEITKQKKWKELLHLEYQIKELTKYKTYNINLTSKQSKKLEELKKEMREYEAFFSTQKYKVPEKATYDCIFDDKLD